MHWYIRIERTSEIRMTDAFRANLLARKSTVRITEPGDFTHFGYQMQGVGTAHSNISIPQLAIPCRENTISPQ
jgi:hypothetical protein